MGLLFRLSRHLACVLAGVTVDCRAQNSGRGRGPDPREKNERGGGAQYNTPVHRDEKEKRPPS